jgi:SAM-dependent methyltransferase
MPAPDEVLKAKWRTWQELQNNGLFSYSNAPEFNLSVGDRSDAAAFKSFCEVSGIVLDVGCGPQEYPSYLPETRSVVGIDPLLGCQPRGFAFVQGVGEYLPFRNETFDHIIYATSLDHIIDPRRSLAEAHRCLKEKGRISLWIDSLAPDYQAAADRSGWRHYRLLARKGFKSLSRHGWIGRIGLRRTLSYVNSVARMKVPEGAIDYFHFEHLTIATVSNWLSDLGLRTIREQEYTVADSLFLQAEKEHGAIA